MSRKGKKILYSIGGALVAIGIILYLLADRYLIEHVETLSQPSVISQSQLDTSTSSTSSTSSVTSVTQSSSTQQPVITDNSYQSEDKSITITKYTEGSGSNTITYYVADVQLSDATDLSAALAKDTFGRNIIEYTSQIAEDHNAIFAINGDYYGFRSDGVIIRNGVLYRDVPVRTGLAFYQDGSMKIYDETEVSAQELLDDGVWNTYSFGPALLEDSEIADGLEHVQIDTNLGNHSIQASNPRTGIGIIDNNHFLFIVVDGRSSGYSKGMTLTEFAQLFKDLGCTDAYNLDGGGSSTMYFNGEVVNNPLGKNKERGTSDILYIA